MSAEDSDFNEPLYRVVCAAIRQENLIICGFRHYDSIMRAVIFALVKGDTDRARQTGLYACEQGFVNNKGEFITREQAWVIARKAGQIIRLVGSQKDSDTGSLFSENLY